MSRIQSIALVCLVGATCLIGETALGAEPAVRRASPAERDSVDYILDPIEVVGEREDEQGRPRTQVHVRSDQVRRYAPVSALDALVGVPGIDAIKTGPWSARPSIRGLSGNRVAVLVDGVPLNPPRGHGAEPSVVPIDRIQEVDVTLGSVGTENGLAGLGGAVDLITHRPLFASVRRLDLSIGARGAAPGDAWGTQAELRLVGSHFGLEAARGASAVRSLTTPAGDVARSGFHDGNGSLRMAGLWSRWNADVEASRSAAWDVGLPAFASPGGGEGSYPLNARSALRTEIKMADSQGRPVADLFAWAQRQDVHFVEATVDSAFVRNRFVGTRETRSSDEVTNDGEEIRLGGLLHHGSRLRVQVGAHGEQTRGPRTTDTTVRNRTGETTSTEGTRGQAVPDASRLSLYSSTSTRLAVGPAQFEAALRWDRVRSAADSTSDGRVPEVDETSEGWSTDFGSQVEIGPFAPYARVATGFREPNLDERLFDGYVHGALRVFGNPALEKESSRTWEAGLRFRSSTHLRSAEVSVYRSDVEDMIELVYLGQLYLIPRFQYRNVSRARIEGMEGTLQLAAGDFELLLSGAIPKGTNRETDTRLNSVGASRLTTDLHWRCPQLLPQGVVSLRQRWVASADAGDEVFDRPGYQALNAEVSTVVGSTTVALAVRNLLDEHYRETISLIDEPGRTFAISVRHDLSWPRERDVSAISVEKGNEP